MFDGDVMAGSPADIEHSLIRARLFITGSKINGFFILYTYKTLVMNTIHHDSIKP
jgi:hypothetical protein